MTYVTAFTIAAIAFLCSAAAATSPLTLTPEQEAKLAIYTPQPEYPMRARAYRMAGNGLFIIRIHIRTGLVKDVRIERSTGWSTLDSAAKRALMQWRFKPGTANLSPIKVQLPNLKDAFVTEDSFVKLPVHFVIGQ